MHNEEFLVVLRVLSFIVFLFSLASGWYLMKNFERLFGVDQTMPSENSSARAYSKIQVFAVWAHLTAASGAFAVLLH